MNIDAFVRLHHQSQPALGDPLSHPPMSDLKQAKYICIAGEIVGLALIFFGTILSKIDTGASLGLTVTGAFGFALCGALHLKVIKSEVYQRGTPFLAIQH